VGKAPDWIGLPIVNLFADSGDLLRLGSRLGCQRDATIALVLFTLATH
jgi:hypothetical protein